MWKMGPQGSSSCFNKYLNIFKQSRTLTGKKKKKQRNLKQSIKAFSQRVTNPVEENMNPRPLTDETT